MRRPTRQSTACRTRVVCLALGVGATVPANVAAQGAPARSLPWPTDVADLRLRDAQLLGRATTDGYLLRSASSAELANGGRAPTARLRALVPSIVVARNSAIPFSLNDGALWAGRGTSALVRGGVVLRSGRLTAIVAPEVIYADNAAFDLRPSTAPGRSPFASPWHAGRASIDLPSRFGDRAIARVSAGQSTLAVAAGPVTLGGSTENAWWGPGRWSALALSNNAEGFPHLFVRTARPVTVRGIGTWEARYMLGAVTPSLYLDTAITRGWRAFNGVTATLRPRGAPNLTLGLTRTTVAPLDRPAALGAHALDAMLRWSPAPLTATDRPRADQLTGAHARWVLPAARAELYGEWARQGRPRSLREFLVAPYDGRAVTFGARALRPLGSERGAAAARYLRLEIEHTATEQSIALRDRPVPAPFYTGLATREGYTHRGQLLGAAVGPGASAQWLATDLVRARGALGLVLGRVRWENDALYEQPNANFFRHDVTTLAGLRAHLRLPQADVHGDATWAKRYNYLFQNGIANPGGRRTVDVSNVTVGLAVTPR